MPASLLFIGEAETAVAQTLMGAPQYCWQKDMLVTMLLSGPPALGPTQVVAYTGAMPVCLS